MINLQVKIGILKKFADYKKISRTNFVLLCILLTGLAFRVVQLLAVSAIEVDGIAYARMAQCFVKGAIGEGLKEVFPPLYPFCIALFHLLIPDAELAARLVSLILGVLLIYLTFVFLTKLIGESKALYGSAFVAIHPYLVKYSATVLSESLAIVLVCVMVYEYYKGWTENSGRDAAISGFLLSLVYLTRPEYFVWFVPLSLLLLVKRRYFHMVLFLICFGLLTFAYIYYIRNETGYWVITKKAILFKNRGSLGPSYYSYALPMLPVLRMIKHIPVLLFDFANAMLPQFLLLALIGFWRVKLSYRIMFAAIVVFHMLPIAGLNYSSKRYYVEFIPLIAIFVSEGTCQLKDFIARYRGSKAILITIFGMIVCSCLLMVSGHPGADRSLNKKAGIYLLSNDPNAIVLSRLPQISYYADSPWISMNEVNKRTTDCKTFNSVVKQMGVKYAAIDERTEQEYRVISRCVQTSKPVVQFSGDGDFLKLYSIK